MLVVPCLIYNIFKGHKNIDHEKTKLHSKVSKLRMRIIPTRTLFCVKLQNLRTFQANFITCDRLLKGAGGVDAEKLSNLLLPLLPVTIDVQIHLVRLASLQTDNFHLFLCHRTDKQQTFVCKMSKR
jgi:hypothetical protein